MAKLQVLVGYIALWGGVSPTAYVQVVHSREKPTPVPRKH